MVNSVTTKLAELNLEDRFLFDETMENKEAYQAAVSILLEREIELLERPETEKELRVSPELRQVRLDVVSMDLQKTVYHTEMQKKDTGNLKKRSRYYQAQMDVSLLEPGSVDFMEYITASTDAVAKRSASRRIKLIHEHVRKIKASEKMGVKYMQLWEEKVLIREEGRAEILVKSVETVMKNFEIDLQKACEGIGTTVEEYYRAKEGR